jgi:hypothetical protein
MKCEGLDNDQASAASVPPPGFTLTGLVQLMAEVERNLFRRARHKGHADLVRERLDGTTGVRCGIWQRWPL